MKDDSIHAIDAGGHSMSENYNITTDASLQDNELRCSLKTFLKIADQLGNFEFKVILDDRIPLSHVSLSACLLAEIERDLGIAYAPTEHIT
ncbi:MAG: hypothetical protein P8M30_05365 [Planctomycetaceae bacterium]|nr:hypothetical protein [Planctomycetaceae bacterium]MDC0307961.1 hypothetical protein [Planctomycetaceae bacterium]MDG2388731.1 hypothetical protein [Planctomycetaceae bacterium]